MGEPTFFKEPCPVVRAIAPCVAHALWGRSEAQDCTSAQRRQARNIAQNIKRALAEQGLLRGFDWILSGDLAAKDRNDRISLEQGVLSDPMERMIADALNKAGMPAIHEGDKRRAGIGPTFDFDLGNGVYIEVKRMHTPRVEKQLAQAENVILIQGKQAAEWFSAAIAKATAEQEIGQ
jgi:hypothetical protein